MRLSFDGLNSRTMTTKEKYEEAAKAKYPGWYDDYEEKMCMIAFQEGASFAEKEIKVELSNYAYQADLAKRERDQAEAREKEAHNAAIDKALECFREDPWQSKSDVFTKVAKLKTN